MLTEVLTEEGAFTPTASSDTSSHNYTQLQSIRTTQRLANVVSKVIQQLVSHNELHRISQCMIVNMSHLNVMRMDDDNKLMSRHQGLSV